MSKFENLPATSRRPRRMPPAKIGIKGIQGNVVSFGSPGLPDTAWRKQLKAAFGTLSNEFVDMALHHLERAARIPADSASDMAINGAIAMIAFDPKNEMEAALALQAACTHMVAMAIMARIGGAGGSPHRADWEGPAHEAAGAFRTPEFDTPGNSSRMNAKHGYLVVP